MKFVIFVTNRQKEYLSKSRMAMMNYTFDTSMQETMVLTDAFHTNAAICEDDSLYKIVWVQEGKLSIAVDHEELELGRDEIISVSKHHRIEFREVSGTYVALLFNEDFYGDSNHLVEPSHTGILFNNTSTRVVRLILPPRDAALIRELIDRMSMEYIMYDNLRGEMLNLLLKRLTIICIRLARKQLAECSSHDRVFDTIQRYYTLVDLHFKEKKQVKEYAAMLHRSPKTLSNMFATYGMPSPLRIIQERVLTEAKRLLLNTTHSVKEISVILGFESVGTFSRFFKNATGENMSAYRKAALKKL